MSDTARTYSVYSGPRGGVAALGHSKNFSDDDDVDDVDIAGNKRVQTSIDATMRLNNSKRVTTATNKIRINYVKHS